MDTRTPFTSPEAKFARADSPSSNTIPVSTFGRAGERHVTGTITRRQVDQHRWLTEAPRRYVVGFALLFAPRIYRGLTEGSDPQSVAVLTIVLAAAVFGIVSLQNLIAQRRITNEEESGDATHIASGVLLGSGPLSAGRSATQVGIYATNHGVLAVTEKRGQRRELDVHRLDLTATPSGRVTSSGFMVDGEQYALRAVRGQIRPSSL